MNDKTPEWIAELPKRIEDWAFTLRDPKRFGLFKDCIDAEMPSCFPPSGVIIGWLKDFGSFEKSPGYSKAAMAETAKYVQSFQQPDTGLFIDPQLDPRYEMKDDEKALLGFRRAVSHYTIILLSQLGAKPLYPFSMSGGSGGPDPAYFVKFVKTADWDKPWASGSNAARMAREIFWAIEGGRDDFIPAFCDGLEFVLSKQNPETGMMGSSRIPLYEQISGALKVIATFYWDLPIEVSYLDRLADSCVEHHLDRGFYPGSSNMCWPRNVMEMCVVCLDHSDYRREELLETMRSIVDDIHKYQMPDGAFSSDLEGTRAINWNSARVAGPSATPRSNVNGTQCAVWTFGFVAPALGWKNLPFHDPLAGRKERAAAYRYRIVRAKSGKIQVVENKPAAKA